MKTFDAFGEVLEFLLSNPSEFATTGYDAKRGRVFNYVDALRCLGYDNAHKTGHGASYDELVLNLRPK